MNYALENFIDMLDDMSIANDGLSDETFEEAAARMKAEFEQHSKEMDFAHKEAVKNMREDFEKACKQSEKAWMISLVVMITAMAAYIAILLKFFYFTKERKYLKAIKDDIMPKIKSNRKEIKQAVKTEDFNTAIKLHKENLKLFKELESKVDAVGSSITVSNIKDDNTGISATKKIKRCELYKLLLLRSIHQGITETELAIKVYSSK